jgi:divalent metal cation (Fe/Co/Zn/Cd) transporter
MSEEDDKWNMNRIPTRWERIYGSFFSIIIFVLMTLFLYASFLRFIKSEEVSKNSLITLCVAVLLFAGSGYLLLRVALGKRRKPSARAIITTGYVLGATSCMLLILPVFGLGNTPYLLSTGFIGLAGSASIISQGKRRGSS